MSELSAVLAFFVLIALLASRIAREQRQESARNDDGLVIDELPSATKALEEADPSLNSLCSHASAGRR